MSQKKARKTIQVRDLMPLRDVKGGRHHRHRHTSALNQNADRDYVPRGGYGIHQPQEGITVESRTVVRFTAVRLCLSARVPNEHQRMIAAPTLCCLRGFHLFGIFAEPRFAIAPRTVMECRLGSNNVCCVAFPSFQDWSLQSPSVRKAQLPRQVPDTI